MSIKKMEKTEELKNKAKELGIILIKITDTEDISFTSETIPDYFKKFIPKSAIVAIQNYNFDEVSPSPLYGINAPFVRSNYYKELKKKLEKLSKYIKNNYNGNSYISCNGSIREKILARKAGIGSYGKNQIISNEKYGSYIIIGLIITDIEFEKDSPSEMFDPFCKNCNLCVKHCPTGAINLDGTFTREKCLQYMGQNKELKEEQIKFWDNRFYGCEICQKVCPKNKNIPQRTDFPENGKIGDSVYLPEIIFLSDDEIKHKFRGSQLALSWVEPEALIKNALIALSKTEEGKKFVLEFIKNGRENMREMAKKILLF